MDWLLVTTFVRVMATRDADVSSTIGELQRHCRTLYLARIEGWRFSYYQVEPVEFAALYLDILGIVPPGHILHSSSLRLSWFRTRQKGVSPPDAILMLLILSSYLHQTF